MINFLLKNLNFRQKSVVYGPSLGLRSENDHKKNEANGFSTGTQPADISITKNLGSKHNTDVLSQGIRLFTEFHT